MQAVFSIRRIIGLCLLTGICVAVGAEESSTVSNVAVQLVSGQVIKGEIVMKNDEIIVLHTPSGRTYQFPVAEVRTVESLAKTKDKPSFSSDVAARANPVAVRIQASVGGIWVPREQSGTAFGVDVAMGTRNLLNRQIFLGGSVSYRGAVIRQNLHFIPVQLVASVPCMPSSKHSPEVGVSVGYGFSAGSSQGGVCCGVDVAWRYCFNQHSALLLGLNTFFQQTSAEVEEMVDERRYAYSAGRGLVALNVKLALQF